MADELDIESTLFQGDLEKRAKARPLHELVAEEYFTVQEVLSQTNATSFTPGSEMVFGGRSPEYSGGYKTNLAIIVNLKDKFPITKLNFEGNSTVRAGDRILARIPKYEGVEVFREIGEPMCGDDDLTETIYLPRQDYSSEEEAIEIRIIEIGTGRVLRTDRSVNYPQFVKRD